jgi:hypothetical protein
MPRSCLLLLKVEYCHQQLEHHLHLLLLLPLQLQRR